MEALNMEYGEPFVPHFRNGKTSARDLARRLYGLPHDVALSGVRLH
jgi:hypothetical protein